MDELREYIVKSRGVKRNSANTYIKSLLKLKQSIDGEEGFDDISFLYDFKRVKMALDAEKTLTSRRNKLSAVLVALECEKPIKYDLLDEYISLLKTFNTEYNEFLVTQKKTDKQRDNWIDYDEIIEFSDKLEEEIEPLLKQKKRLTGDEFNKVQRYVLLRTYLEFPLRNDFADMKVVKYTDYRSMDVSDYNYLVVFSKGRKELRINSYKTDKRLGSRIFEVPADLNQLFNDWLRINKSGWLFVKQTKTDEPMNPNYLTKYLIRMFKDEFGKAISTSMLRHITISNALKGTPTLTEQKAANEAIANKYLHSAAMNQLYRKVD